MKSKTKNAKLMSQCHKSAVSPVNMRLSGCDKELRQPCHTMSHVTKLCTSLVTPPCRQGMDKQGCRSRISGAWRTESGHPAEMHFKGVA